MEISSEKITIRTAGREDAAVISVLAAVTFYEAYFEQDEASSLSSYIIESFDKTLIEEDLANPDSKYFLLYLDEKAVGYAKLLRNSTAECIASQNAVELKRIYTLERVWGRGLGAKLLDHCLAAARSENFELLWLGVWEENLRALRFYEKHGFKKLGTIIFPYGDYEGTNFVMAVDLSTDQAI